MPDYDSLVSVIVPTRDRRAKLLRCVKSLFASEWSDLEVIIVDDASGYDVAADFQGLDRVRVLKNQTRALLSASRNSGASVSKGRYLFFVDDDNEVDPRAISELVSILRSNSRAAVATPVIFRLEKPRQVWTSVIQKGPLPGLYPLGKAVPSRPSITFSFHDAFMVRREAFREAGGFDARTFPITLGELDLAHRLEKRGSLAVLVPAAKVWHDVAPGHTNIDPTRAFYLLRNRIILMKKYRYDSFLFYSLCILPLLSAYYSVQVGRFAKGGRLASLANMIRGACAGFSLGSWQGHPRPWTSAPSEPLSI